MSNSAWLRGARAHLPVLAGIASALTLALPLTEAVADNGFRVLHYFARTRSGPLPQGPLVQAADGMLYGVTRAGGRWDKGSVFQATTSGEVKWLYSFPRIGTGPWQPSTGLAWGNDGNLYGPTWRGGKANGWGTVYRITVDGQLTVVHEFAGGHDGEGADTRLLLASDGNLYGTTSYGLECCGTIYRVTGAGEFQVVHEFVPAEGEGPGPLTEARDGLLYGTTLRGGAHGWGTIYRMTKEGDLEVLHNFEFSPGGPVLAGSDLLQLADGSFLGTSHQGGIARRGTVYRMTPDGEVSVVHSFLGLPSEGAYPSGLIRARNGYFYGTTSGGGANNYGTVFRMRPDGSVLTLHSFSGPDGGGPCSELLEAADGLLYGLTCNSGKKEGGTMYRIEAN